MSLLGAILGAIKWFAWAIGEWWAARLLAFSL
jgi:hypothetical protein